MFIMLWHTIVSYATLGTRPPGLVLIWNFRDLGFVAGVAAILMGCGGRGVTAKSETRLTLGVENSPKFLLELCFLTDRSKGCCDCCGCDG